MRTQHQPEKPNGSASCRVRVAPRPTPMTAPKQRSRSTPGGRFCSLPPARERHCESHRAQWQRPLILHVCCSCAHSSAAHASGDRTTTSDEPAPSQVQRATAAAKDSQRFCAGAPRRRDVGRHRRDPRAATHEYHPWPSPAVRGACRLRHRGAPGGARARVFGTEESSVRRQASIERVWAWID